MAKKRYFPNNWKKYKDADDDEFIPHMFIEVMEWKVAGWELPSDVHCIIRATHLETKKVQEFVYKQPKSAHSRIKQLFRGGLHEFCITYHETQQFVAPAGVFGDDEDNELPY